MTAAGEGRTRHHRQRARGRIESERGYRGIGGIGNVDEFTGGIQGQRGRIRTGMRGGPCGRELSGRVVETETAIRPKEVLLPLLTAMINFPAGSVVMLKLNRSMG